MRISSETEVIQKSGSTMKRMHRKRKWKKCTQLEKKWRARRMDRGRKTAPVKRGDWKR